MSTEEKNDQEQAPLEQPVPLFGYELIRDVLLGELLGPDAPHVLYWGGKTLARRFPCASQDELALFCREAGWGELHLEKEAKQEHHYRLSGGVTARRFDTQVAPSFSLESGFLAEQVALAKQCAAEAVYDVNKRGKMVRITVKWESGR